MEPSSSEPLWAWGIFAGVLLAGIFVDLFLHRGERADSHKTAVAWAIFWVFLGLAFGGFVWVMFGAQKATDYMAAWLIEKSLSVDNLFVFLIIFQSLRIPQENQRTVLSWGIFGALVFRMIFIFLGSEAIERWSWVAYVFGAILVWAAIKIVREAKGDDEPEENKAIAWLSRHIPVTHTIHGNHFTAIENGRRVATPLLLAVLGLELTDIMFAIDSVPAAFSVTLDKYIIYSSNAFAILGLRSLYVVLAKTISELEYLHYGLAGVLAFAGLKLIFHSWIKIPGLLSVAIIIVLIGGSVVASLLHKNPVPPGPPGVKNPKVPEDLPQAKDKEPA